MALLPLVVPLVVGFAVLPASRRLHWRVAAAATYAAVGVFMIYLYEDGLRWAGFFDLPIWLLP